jgi:tetratricopeptide (TPR) repeat protein
LTLVRALASACQRLFPRNGTTLPGELGGHAAIHCYNVSENYHAWVRCRERAEFHLGRARRAKDRRNFRTAAREIERALRYDDTNEAYFQLLAQCQLNGLAPDAVAARRTLEHALSLNPRNPFTLKLLLQAHEVAGREPGVNWAKQQTRRAARSVVVPQRFDFEVSPARA